jgi:hypothetical protein
MTAANNRGYTPSTTTALNLDEWWYLRHTKVRDVGDKVGTTSLVLLHKSCFLQV